MSPKPRSQYLTSDLSRYCVEVLGEPDFHYCDGDVVKFTHHSLPMTYAWSTGILRLLESKHSGEDVRRSQREMFPILAALIDTGVESGVVAPESGVFVVEGEYPFDGAIVRQVRGYTQRPNRVGLQYKQEHDLTAEQFATFMRCRKAA